VGVTQRIGLGVRVVAAASWAWLMVMCGWWAILSGPHEWPIFRGVSLLSGLTMAAGGQLVFMVLVADRVFPGASRRMMLALELVSFLAFLSGLGAVLWALQAGGVH
jgi:hypothetical protein